MNKSGVIAPNCHIEDFHLVPGGRKLPGAFWTQLGMSGATYVKFSYPEHSPDDVATAKLLGYKTILRQPGEGIPHHEITSDMIAKYKGLVDIIEVGNEPKTDNLSLWDHKWYLDDVVTNCLGAATVAGIRLCTPGWQQEARFPDVGTELGQKLLVTYKKFSLTGVHCYDAAILHTDGVRNHILEWATLLNKNIIVSEYGIAGKTMLAGPSNQTQAANDADKAYRYRLFLSSLPACVEAACCFIMGGTDEWSSFADASKGYDPAGPNRYWLAPEAWKVMGIPF